MASSEQKLRDWLTKNPEGYYELPMKEIADQSNTSIAAVSQILPRLIAKREGVLPSEVKQRRFSKTQNRIDRDKLWKMVDQGMDVADIAFLLECNEGSVREIIRKGRPEKSEPLSAQEADETKSDE